MVNAKSWKLRSLRLGSGGLLVRSRRDAIILEPGPLKRGADAPIGVSRLGGQPICRRMSIGRSDRRPTRKLLPSNIPPPVCLIALSLVPSGGSTGSSAHKSKRKRIQTYREACGRSQSRLATELRRPVDFAEIHLVRTLDGTFASRLSLFTIPTLAVGHTREDQAQARVIFTRHRRAPAAGAPTGVRRACGERSEVSL